jgi:hypothetical protein
MMFINSNLGLLLPEKLGVAVLAAGLSQALGSAAGIIEAIGLVGCVWRPDRCRHFSARGKAFVGRENQQWLAGRELVCAKT